MNEKYFYEVNIFPIFERAIRKLVLRYKNSIYFIYNIYICHAVIGNICNKGTNCTCFASCRRAILKLIGICVAVTNAAFAAVDVFVRYRFNCHLLRFAIVLEHDW